LELPIGGKLKDESPESKYQVRKRNVLDLMKLTGYLFLAYTVLFCLTQLNSSDYSAMGHNYVTGLEIFLAVIIGLGLYYLNLTNKIKR